MKNFVFRVLAAFVLLSIGSIVYPTNVYAAPTTFYVSTTGDDAGGDGSSSAPWKTLSKACEEVVTAGDTIHVNAGTYTESIKCNLAIGVNIEGAGVENTIIKSSITGEWSSFIEMQSPEDTNGSQSISNFTLDGQYVSLNNNKTWVGIWITGRSNVSIHDTKIINFKNRGVIFDGNDITDPLNDPGHYATGNKFYNNTVLNSAEYVNGQYGTGALNIGGQQGMEIYNNTIVQDQRPEGQNGWPIKLWDNGWLKGVKIYDNTIVKKPYGGTYPGENGWDFAIELFNVSGLEIADNNIQGSIDLNYSYKGSYPYSAWIHGNTLNHLPINDHFESGIILEFSTQGALIENNIINNSSTGIQFNTRGPGNSGGYTYPAPTGGYSALTDNIIRNNLLSNIYQPSGCCGGVGIMIVSEGTNDPYIRNLDIYNNTIIAKEGDAPYVGIDFTSMTSPMTNVSGVKIKNNIVNGFESAWIQGTSGNTRMSNVSIMNNNAFGNGNDNLPDWPGGNPTSYTYTNNLNVDPLFVGNNNYNLQATSPLINAGVDIGLPYNGSAPDIGYVENASGGSGSGGNGGGGSGSGSGGGGSSGGSGSGGSGIVQGVSYANVCPSNTTGVYPNCVSIQQTPIPLPPVVAPTNPIYFIKPLKINIRSEKSILSKLVVSLKNRTLVEILEGNQSTEWVKVKTLDGKIGYVRSKYTQPLIKTGDKASITGLLLNLRKSESFTSPSLKLLKRTDILEVLSVSSDSIWTNVKTTDGKVGFVNKFLLKVL